MYKEKIVKTSLTILFALSLMLTCCVHQVFAQITQTQSPEDQTLRFLSISAKGAGQTTGHIATITVKNNTDQPVTVAPQIFYIPSDGKYQSYVGRIPEGITIQPGETVDIPVTGICTDVHTPPVPDGTDMPPIDTWIPIKFMEAPDPLNPSPPGSVSIIPTEPVDPFHPSMIPDITGSPGYTPVTEPTDGISVTYPGTEIPVGGTIDPREAPRTFAPVIVRIVEEIEDAVVVIQADPNITTPFSNNPEREREAIVQQTVWISMGILTGDPYEKKDFADNVYEQFETSTGVPVTNLPEEDKDKIDSGGTDFWNTFMATGVEAKVIRTEPESETEASPEAPIEISEKLGGCTSELSININPPYALDMQIAEEWGNAEERQTLINEVRDALSKEVQLTSEGAFAAYDINRHPTSSTSFWKAGNVGGFASAYAKAWLGRADGGSEWVWGTDRLDTRAEGTMDYTLAYLHDDECRAIVAGSALIRIRASSSAFDAMAGNTHLENDTEQLNFLRGTKYAGKLAVEWLILRARGRANNSFAQHVREDIQGQIEGAVEEAIIEEVQALAEQYLGGYLEQMGLSVEELMNLDLELPSLEEAIEEFFGIDIPNLEDLEAFISDGIETTFNLFFVSNTYATANGALVVHVGSNTGSVIAHTSVHYSRESTEETQEAIKWSGEQCQETLVSDAQPDALTIHTTGFSNMVAEAASRYGFGNGQAEAFLESMNMQILAGICICPAQRRGIDESTYTLDVQGTLGWYTASEDHQSALENVMAPFLQQVQDEIQAELDGMTEAQVNNLTEAQFKQMLESKVRAWGEDNKYSWSPCENQ